MTRHHREYDLRWTVVRLIAAPVEQLGSENVRVISAAFVLLKLVAFDSERRV